MDYSAQTKLKPQGLEGISDNQIDHLTHTIQTIDIGLGMSGLRDTMHIDQEGRQTRHGVLHG